MRKIYSMAMLLLCTALLSKVTAQTVLSSTGTFANDNGTGTVTFNLQNTNSSGIIITDIAGVTGTSGAVPVELYYNPTPVNGAPANISTASGWILIASATITGVVNTSTTVTQPFLSGLSFTIPANTTYGFAVYASGQRYHSIVGSTPISAGGVNMLYGANISYGGGTPPAAPTNSPRGWIGQITFVPSLPCTAPPTPGTATTTASNVCLGNTFGLNLTGHSIGNSQTYQWQSGTTATGTYTNVGTSSSTPSYTATATATLYYRCALTCGASTTYSTPVLVSVPALFPAGTYTINSAAPTAGTNFQTFNAAIDAIKCGTAGPVIFNVATGSGPYNEQVLIPEIMTNSATNTITVNGNGATLTYNSTASAAPFTLGLNGSDYFRFNNLNIVGTNTTYALVGHLWNGANNNKFTNCTFTAPADGTSTSQIPFSISGSAISGTATGLGGDSNLVSGCTMNSGYYNTCIVGNTGTLATGNQVVNCNLKDFYFYGSYNYYASGTLISGNNIERPLRSTLSTFYGIYITTGCLKLKIEKNKIHDPFGGSTNNTSSFYGIYQLASGTAGNEHQIINNTLYNMRSWGSLYCIYLSSYNYVNVFHNTIVADDTAATGGLVYGIYSTGTAGIDIRNNIVFITRGGTGTKYCLYYSGTKTSNRNDLYVSSAGANSIGYFATAFPTLANWQTANSSAWDQQSISASPLFTSAASGNLLPTALTMNNAGTSAGVTTDILGVTRSTTTPDVGAYEFGEVPPFCLSAPINPANGSSNACGGALTLRWNRAPNATGYDVYLNTGTGTPTTVISANQTDTFYNATTVVGPYVWKVVPKNVYGAPTGCNTWTFTTVLGVAPTTTVSVTPNDTICIGTTTVFSAVHTNGGAAPSYQWKKNGANVGTNSPSYTDNTLVTGDSIQVIMTSNSNVCLTSVTASSNKIRMTVNAAPAATISATGPVDFCYGGAVTLTGGPAGAKAYQWVFNNSNLTGATTTSYVASYSGYYRIRVTGQNNCPALSDSIRVTVFPTPFPLVDRNGNVLTTASFYTSYQWYRNNQAIPGATTNSFTVSRDGIYKVAVTDIAACGGTSKDIPVNSLDVAHITGNEISIYPNPASNMVTISSPVSVDVIVKSVDGKAVASQRHAKTLDISHLSEGIYLLYLSDEKGQLLKVEKLVKNRN